jgi:hypothetical protein
MIAAAIMMGISNSVSKTLARVFPKIDSKSFLSHFVKLSLVIHENMAARGSALRTYSLYRRAFAFFMDALRKVVLFSRLPHIHRYIPCHAESAKSSLK